MLTTEDIKYKKAKRVTADYGINDLYKYYAKITLPDLRQEQKVFSDILKDANVAIVESLLSNPSPIHLFCRCGDLRIRKTKMSFRDTNGLRIDWAATKKANTKVYHMNEHRDNHRYRFYWDKPKMVNIKAYSFRPTRTNKRALAHVLKNKPEVDFYL